MKPETEGAGEAEPRLAWGARGARPEGPVRGRAARALATGAGVAGRSHRLGTDTGLDRTERRILRFRTDGQRWPGCPGAGADIGRPDPRQGGQARSHLRCRPGASAVRRAHHGQRDSRSPADGRGGTAERRASEGLESGGEAEKAGGAVACWTARARAEGSAPTPQTSLLN